MDTLGCHHLPPTSTNHGVEPHSNITFNPDTTSALTITILALCKDIECPVKGDETVAVA
jgi:hypothetical protein